MNDIITTKLTAQQKKIITTVAVITVPFVICWLFVYLPTRGMVNQLKAELNNVQNQIQQIEAMIEKGKTIEEGIKSLKERYVQIDSKFPEREEEGLRLLSDFARKQNIGIVSIKSQPRTAFLDKDSQKVEIEGKSCWQLSVSIEMKSGYADLLEYLKNLKESLPAYATFERLRINKDPSGMAKLNITMDLNLYLLS